jgi:two-component system phosphate regulon sensor histidine kinase PhoR
MFGFTSLEIEKGSLVSLLRHHKLVELWQESVATGEAQTISLEMPQQSMHLQVVASPMGEPLLGHTLLIFLDMTRVQQLETVRQDFISNVSHELRTPLASLKALTETLLDGALDDPPAARRFLTLIETEVDSLSLMVQEILELSRIESGRVPLKIKPVPPVELLAAAHKRLRLQADRAGLTVIQKCDSNLPLVMADRPRMVQVVMNLLHNAIKYTPTGGEITLLAYFARNLDPEKDEVVFQVRDTGVGIPEDDLPRIFERFYKADRARSGGGTGLGLAIGRHMVETHRGRIWVESTEGEGSTFSFTLPVVMK